MRVYAALTPAEARDGSGHLCIVVDVLRATTTISVALAAGATAIWAVESVEGARALSKQDPDALLGGERNGRAPAGFALGNSPPEYSEARVGGRRVILTTTNGTRALATLGETSSVVTAALHNVSATVRFALAFGSDVLLIAAGRAEGALLGLDDVFVLGLIAQRLSAAGAFLDDGAITALAVWEHFQGDAERAFRQSAHGRFLIESGLGGDLWICAQQDLSDLIPRVRPMPGYFLIERA